MRQLLNSSFRRIFVCAGLFVVMSGCTTFTGQRSQSSDAGLPEILPPDIAAFVNNTRPRGVAHFATSPWGDVEIEIVDSYFSASGRACSALSINIDDSTVQPAIVCQGDEQWELVRPVTHALSDH